MTFLSIVSRSTNPFSGQKPGTAGLRKKVQEFFQGNYTENYIQCIFEALGSAEKSHTLVLGGDGRYGLKDTILKICQMSAANNVSKLIIGQNGILSTPAASALISKYNADGGFILSASHNPGGPDGDFGIKFNMSNGGPAQDSFTDKIFKISQFIQEYKICPDLELDTQTLGTSIFKMENGKTLEVEVIDSCIYYVEMMKEIFNFEEIKKYLANKKILVNSLHGVTGPYVERIFDKELGVHPQNSFMKTNILEDFGGEHPDPNLTYAKDLIDAMKNDESFVFGVAFDGDGDRNMILGSKGFFVTPCDSLAVLAHHLESIPYFQKNSISGFARSMPTSRAVDIVAKAKGVQIYETPTGWKYFANLLDDGKICLCGEESFGTGSNHIREKDGIWAALAWLQILSSQKMSVQEVLESHWSTYGRSFFSRYDYENCEATPCENMMSHLESFISDSSNLGKKFSALGKTFLLSACDNFSYEDPIDKSLTTGQGIRLLFTDESRIIFRLSGTGSSGATVRLYVDSFEKEKSLMRSETSAILAPLLQIALSISKLEEFTGRTVPDVIT